MRGPVTILGDGQLGVVLAMIASENGFDTTIWSPIASESESIRRTRATTRLPGFVLPAPVAVTHDERAALEGASNVICAIPSQYLRSVVTKVRPLIHDDALIVSTTKGLEHGSAKRASAVWLELTRREVVVVSGPNIASELAQKRPAAMIAASSVEEDVKRTQLLLMTPWLRVYCGADPLGVELAGALKNVIALAAGMLDGIDAGFNAKSMLLSRGLAEMMRYGSALGAHEATFFGLAGVGDLATTCFCPQGRNRSCGEAIGRGATLDEYLAKSLCVVEGVETARVVVQHARSLSIELPIIEAVARVLDGALSVRDAMQLLMVRDASSERG
ncbi:MAG: NAD(P)-dependent glycerol-3-phosphate dehydrogenase [Planctomycetota bacterium]|nr:NAD(P)-dependent glycerol-3-phosphate dehydrogenase [Planctomycetota bacterium]